MPAHPCSPARLPCSRLLRGAAHRNLPHPPYPHPTLTLTLTPTPHQLIATFLIPFAIIALTNFMGKMHDLKMSKKMGADKTLLERLSELEAVIDADDDGIVSPEEYVIFNLKQMGKVDEDTVGLLRDQFKALDADGSGELDANDLVLLTRACEMIGGPSKPKSQR